MKLNGFERVLTTKEGKSLSKIVKEKLQHPRHKALIKYGKKHGKECDYPSDLKLCYDEMLSGLSKCYVFSSNLSE